MKTKLYILKGIQIAFAIIALFLMSCSPKQEGMSAEEKYKLLYGDKEPSTEEVDPLIDDETQEQINDIAEDVGKGAAKVKKLLEDNDFFSNLGMSGNYSLIESKEGLFTVKSLELSRTNALLVQAEFHKKNNLGIVKTGIVWECEPNRKLGVLDDTEYDVQLSVQSFKEGIAYQELAGIDYVEKEWDLNKEEADRFLKANFKDAVKVFNKVVQTIAERSE
jgi:hypothetical protein